MKGNKVQEKNKNQIEIKPQAYELKAGESQFTFKNFYIQYARFHLDDV